MSQLYKGLTTPPPRYFDRKWQKSEQEYYDAVDGSTTLYVGNLSFYTTEEQIYELFSMVGDLKRIIMGLDRANKTPCGFCFVEYYERSSAEACLLYVNGTMLDERVIRTDLDPGFSPERQFGRGASGGQVRDEYRPDYDSGRGGYGRQFSREQPQAYTEFESAAGAPMGGNKRGRDDDDDDQEHDDHGSKAKNPRFRGDGTEDDRD